MPLFGPPKIEKMLTKMDVKGLIKALGYKKDRIVREHAVEALGQIADPLAVEPLIDILNHGSVPLRMTALQTGLGLELDRSLSLYEMEQALDFAIKETDKSIRKTAALALGEIGDQRALKPLGDLFINKDVADVRVAAAIALGNIGEPCRSSRPAMTGLSFALDDDSKFVRIAAAEALGKIGDPDSVHSLVLALEDDDETVHHAADASLKQLGWEPDKN